MFHLTVKPKSVSSSKPRFTSSFTNVMLSGFLTSIVVLPTTLSPDFNCTSTVPSVPLETNWPVVPSILPKLSSFNTKVASLGKSAFPPALSTPVASNCTVEPGVYTSSKGEIVAWSNSPSAFASE